MANISSIIVGAFSVLLFAVPVRAQAPTPTPSKDSSSYVVLAVRPDSSFKSEKASLDDDSFVVEGNVGVNDANQNGLTTSLTLGKAVFMGDGSQTVADQLTASISSGAPDSLYDLFVNSCKNNCPNVDIRDQQGRTPIAFPLITPLPPVPTPNGGVSQTINGLANCPTPPGTLAVPRGSYTNTQVPANCTLELTVTDSVGPTPNGADYEFASLTVPSYAHVIVDRAAIINIKGSGTSALTLGEWSSFGPKAGVNPNDIIVNSNCGSSVAPQCVTITFNYSSHAGMSLYAPYANLHLQRSFRGKGQFIGNIVNGEQTLLLTAAQGTAFPTPVPLHFTTKTQEQYSSQGATVGLPVTVGAPGIRSLTIQDSDALHCFLPTYGVPAALCAASPRDDCVEASASCAGEEVPQAMQICTSQCDGSIASHNGQGAGTLAGQAIAARLNVANNPALGDMVIPPCLCTDLCPYSANTNPTGGGCRRINNTTQQNQGGGGGLEDGITTVNDLLDFADQALSADCSRGGSCTQTCGTAFAPPDPVRIGEMSWALQAINECFAAPGGATLDAGHTAAALCAPFASDPPPTGCCDAGKAVCCPTGATECDQTDCTTIATGNASHPCGACGVQCLPPTPFCNASGQCVAAP